MANKINPNCLQNKLQGDAVKSSLLTPYAEEKYFVCAISCDFKLNLQTSLKSHTYLQLPLTYSSLTGLWHFWVSVEGFRICRPFPDKDFDGMVEELDGGALTVSLSKLESFLNQLDSIPASPVEATVADWKSRLAKVSNKRELATTILELEADINELGSGLPSGEARRIEGSAHCIEAV